MQQSLSEVSLFLIDQVNKVAKKFAQRVFDEHALGITVEQWVLLKLIEESNGNSQIDLASLSHRDPASITRSLNLLEQKKLIERRTIEGNKRQYSVFLTSDGAGFIKKNMELVSDLRDKSLQNLSVAEIQELNRLLKIMLSNMN